METICRIPNTSVNMLNWQFAQSVYTQLAKVHSEEEKLRETLALSNIRLAK